MSRIGGSMLHRIQEVYDRLTGVEKSIAGFFLENEEEFEFSSKNIAAKLYVSEASLSRFAKKCGYKGFRELIYDYDREFRRAQDRGQITRLTKQVVDTYQALLDKSIGLVNEAQMASIGGMLSEADHIFVYGMGSSGIAAREFALRFMRLGLYMEAITDAHIIRMNAALAGKKTLIIAVSLSGATPEIITGVKIAREQGASVLLITASAHTRMSALADEVLVVAGMKNLDGGIMISPQFPILVMADIFFAYYLNTDYYRKASLHTETVSALYRQ